MGMMRKAGEVVQLNYRSDSNASAVEPITLYDANGNVRVLQSYERLVIDTIQFNTEANDTTDLAYVVASVATPATTVPAQPVVAAFEAGPIGAQGFVATGEGLAQPIAATLWLVLVGDAWAGSSVALSGIARIVTGKSIGKLAGYQALLTPGGNMSGQ